MDAGVQDKACEIEQGHQGIVLTVLVTGARVCRNSTPRS